MHDARIEYRSTMTGTTQDMTMYRAQTMLDSQLISVSEAAK